MNDKDDANCGVTMEHSLFKSIVTVRGLQPELNRILSGEAKHEFLFHPLKEDFIESMKIHEIYTEWDFYIMLNNVINRVIQEKASEFARGNSDQQEQDQYLLSLRDEYDFSDDFLQYVADKYQDEMAQTINDVLNASLSELELTSDNESTSDEEETDKEISDKEISDKDTTFDDDDGGLDEIRLVHIFEEKKSLQYLKSFNNTKAKQYFKSLDDLKNKLKKIKRKAEKNIDHLNSKKTEAEENINRLNAKKEETEEELKQTLLKIDDKITKLTEEENYILIRQQDRDPDDVITLPTQLKCTKR